MASNARQVAQARSQERAMQVGTSSTAQTQTIVFMLFLTALGKISQEAEADQSDDDEDTLLLKQKIKATLRV